MNQRTAFDDALAGLSLLLGASLQLRAVAETGSTNTDLLEACRHDAAPQLLVAERQTAGRGRLGRSWLSAPGASLTFSLAWPLPSSSLDGLSLAVGSSLAAALDPQGLLLKLKWPNDLWLQSRKLGGVLIETTGHGAAPCSVVIGVGINVLALPVDVPSSSLQELDPRWTAPLALSSVVPPLVTLLREWRGFDAAAQAAFAARDALRGRAVAGGTWSGVAEGVNASGLLRLRDAQGQLQELRAGEVRLRELT
jgi:BirA family transcriptional regulator, biotin operon repressor / biotin---[acetyl-CoA-carboxylase] ligase